MTARPHQRRAYGLILRYAERDGVIEVPAELRDLAAALPYGPDEVDRGLELFVGAAAGGTLELSDLDAPWIARLVRDGLVEVAADEEWKLSKKGESLDRLLDAYASLWTSLATTSEAEQGFGKAGQS